MVDHVFRNPATEPAWHEWYAGYLHKLVGVPGIDTAQRFKAIGSAPPRFLAMYSVASRAVYESEGYRNMGGGGSQSVRFHPDYELWTRNLFEGLSHAPPVREGERIVVWDRAQRETDGPLASRATWLESVGLHMTTKYRALVVLKADEAPPSPLPAGAYVYEPYTPVLTRSS